MVSTIQGRLLIIFMGFTLLLVGVVAATRAVLAQQADDGVLVNLAGRERMLAQKMAKESLLLASALEEGRTANLTEYRDGLRATLQIFETTLLSLKDGGPAPINLEMTRMRTLPPAANDAIRGQLDDASKKWAGMKSSLQSLISADMVNHAAVDNIILSTGPLVASLNAAVELLQSDSERKVGMLGTVQMLALLLGAALVGAGLFVARSSIAQPIQELTIAAKAMSTGNLNVEFTGRGTTEVRELSASFDRMRASMIAAMDAGGHGRAAADDDF